MSDALAIVLEKPEALSLRRLELAAPGRNDVVVRTRWSGISTGTERLLFSGRMPAFPGMGYPLVPGYETVGVVVEAAEGAGVGVGRSVFVPGANCFGAVRGLFGGAASLLVAPASRVVAVDESLGEQAILLALAATAFHARAGVAAGGGDLIVGHGVLGRLLARLSVLDGGAPPVVWERSPARAGGAVGYEVVDPERDARRDYRTIFDVSGDGKILDTLIARLARGGEIVLAGFYDAPLAFTFPPAFMREARLRVAAEWQPADLLAVRQLVESGRLSLDGLITHRQPAEQAASAYPTAFNDPSCLKMVLDWRTCQ
ncbi:MAG: chlorophyll synthesis pathway protein BchC [Roseiarcus sp.]|jgi:3-hydroxyethyl bacteriochlorophyllide a dehydrogenase